MTNTSQPTEPTKPPRQGERWTPARRAAYEKRRRAERMVKPSTYLPRDAEPFFTVSHAAREAMHSYLDSLESVLVMIGQRDMDPDHIERMAAILQRAESALLARISRGRRSRTAAPDSASNTPTTDAGHAPERAA